MGAQLITLIGYYYKVNRNIFQIPPIGSLCFHQFRIRIFTIKEDNIYKENP
ncbi:hypothetical protein ACV56Z_01525 [Staphylococcus aureus]